MGTTLSWHVVDVSIDASEKHDRKEGLMSNCCIIIWITFVLESEVSSVAAIGEYRIGKHCMGKCAVPKVVEDFLGDDVVGDAERVLLTEMRWGLLTQDKVGGFDASAISGHF